MIIDVPNGPEEDPAWSPDGQRIAFTHTPPTWSGPEEIWVANSDGSAPQSGDRGCPDADLVPGRAANRLRAAATVGGDGRPLLDRSGRNGPLPGVAGHLAPRPRIRPGRRTGRRSPPTGSIGTTRPEALGTGSGAGPIPTGHLTATRSRSPAEPMAELCPTRARRQLSHYGERDDDRAGRVLARRHGACVLGGRRHLRDSVRRHRNPESGHDLVRQSPEHRCLAADSYPAGATLRAAPRSNAAACPARPCLQVRANRLTASTARRLPSARAVRRSRRARRRPSAHRTPTAGRRARSAS